MIEKTSYSKKQMRYIETLKKASQDCCEGLITYDEFNTIFEEVSLEI